MCIQNDDNDNVSIITLEKETRTLKKSINQYVTMIFLWRFVRKTICHKN